jgi:hypothetical protein
MSEPPSTPPQKAKRERSPSFPFISLKTAVGRLSAFGDYFKRHPAPANRAGLAWGLKGESSQAAQTLAALKAFGFIEYSGSGESLQASLTEDSRSFLRAQQESTKRSILARAALRPRAIAKYWHMWNADRPPDPVCLDELILKGAFTEGAAKLFLTVYDETIAYANLTGSDTVIDVQETDEAPMTPAGQTTIVPQAANLTLTGGRLLDEVATSVRYPKVKSPMLQETFYLDEGPVTLSFPSDLSQESYEDLRDELGLFLRRAQRRATGKALAAKAANVGADADQLHEATDGKVDET